MANPPSSIVEWSAGTGTLSSGDWVTASPSGAEGKVTYIIEGDSTAGVAHLELRDSQDFANGDSLSNGAGWSATYTNNSEQRFSVWIDADTKSLQKVHDYFAALTAETTLSETGEEIHEWGRDSQARALYCSGSGFYTERSYGKGVIVVNYGAGQVEYFTDDAGGTYTPPASLTISIHVQDTATDDVAGAQVYIYNTATGEEVMNQDSDAQGDATKNYTGSPINIEIRVRKASPGDTKYKNFSTLGSIGTTDYSLTVTLQEDPINTS